MHNALPGQQRAPVMRIYGPQTYFITYIKLIGACIYIIYLIIYII